jgi:hypothetical protein
MLQSQLPENALKQSHIVRRCSRAERLRQNPIGPSSTTDGATCWACPRYAARHVRRALTDKFIQPQIAGYTVAPSVPQKCRNGDPQGSTSMWAFDVYLKDCGSPWTICMSDKREMSLEAAIVQLARTPVSFRRFLTT